MINKESNDKKTLKSPVILRRIICILCVLLVLSGAGLVVVSAAPGSGDSPTLELYKLMRLPVRLYAAEPLQNWTEWSSRRPSQVRRAAVRMLRTG